MQKVIILSEEEFEELKNSSPSKILEATNASLHSKLELATQKIEELEKSNKTLRTANPDKFKESIPNDSNDSWNIKKEKICAMYVANMVIKNNKALLNKSCEVTKTRLKLVHGISVDIPEIKSVIKGELPDYYSYNAATYIMKLDWNKRRKALSEQIT
jgi:hypothetical protein